MSDKDIVNFPDCLARYLENPYGGLFGNTVQARIIEEVVADPDRIIRPKDLEKVASASAPSVRKSLEILTELGLLNKDSSDSKHPIYRVNSSSKKLTSLTLLAYAIIDDRDGTDLMNEELIAHCADELPERFQPLVLATALKYTIRGATNRTYMFGSTVNYSGRVGPGGDVA